MNSKKPGSPQEPSDNEIHHSIDDIENLLLPKRGGRRRSVYIGEKLYCRLTADNVDELVEIVDLSSGGLALVETSSSAELPLVAGQSINLKFNQGLECPFEVKGTVSNLSDVSFSGTSYKRIGIRFDMKICKSEKDFLDQIPDRLFVCHGLIRPQAFCKDPFFYNEIVLFQVNGFSSGGCDLIVSARCKTILPSQPIEIDIYMPGRGRFLVNVINSSVQYKTNENQFRIFAKFDKPGKKFLDAVSEHLVMFVPDTLPNLLRDQGFRVGELSHAFDISYELIDDEVLSKENLEQGIISPAFKSKETKDELDAYARKISCKLGPNLAGILSLVFPGKDPDKSKFKRGGYEISDEITKGGYLELTDLYLNQGLLLVDILLPLLKNLVRITVQSGSRYLALECTTQIKPILEKIGFKDYGVPAKRKTADGSVKMLQLMMLDVKLALLNKNRFLPDNIWKSVYQELYLFFKKQMEKVKKSNKKI